MAITTAVGNLFTTIATSTSAQTTLLDPDREYLAVHTGIGASLAADENPIFIATAATPDADDTENSNKLILGVGQSLPIGPNVRTITYLTAAGAPRMCLITSPKVFGVR